MSKIIYLLGILSGSLTFVNATEVLVRSSAKGESIFSVEWLGLIVLAFTGFIFIFRSALQIKKIKRLQEKLDTYQMTVTRELDTLGGKDA